MCGGATVAVVAGGCICDAVVGGWAGETRSNIQGRWCTMPSSPVTPLPPDSPRISRTVREEVKLPTPEALSTAERTDFPSADPAVVPTTAPAVGQTTGQWQWVGSVLAVVNGEPIYAHKVINTLDRPLAAEAKAERRAFPLVAEDLVAKQIREFIDNELEYAAAERSLEKNDEQVAKM